MDVREWTRDSYKISTDPALLSPQELNEVVFAAETTYWAQPLPEDVVRTMIDQSLNFGLYDTSTPRLSSAAAAGSAGGAATERTPKAGALVGYARCITDYTTFMYMTDVFVHPSRQGQGLGAWLVACVNEVVDSMPHLRRIVALTTDWERSVPFYARNMGMTTIDTPPPAELGEQRKGLAVLTRIGPGNMIRMA